MADSNQVSNQKCESRVRLDPKKIHAYRTRASIRFDLGKNDLALADISEAIRLNPTDAELVFFRSEIYRTTGDKTRERQDLDEVVRLAPRDAYYAARRGASLLSQMDLDEAIRGLDRAISLDPNMSTNYHNRGICRYYQGDFEKSLADYDAELRLSPNEGYVYHARGETLVALGRYAEAIADFEKAVRLSTDDAETQANSYCNWATVLATCPDDKMRDQKQARELAMKACDLDNWSVRDSLEALAAVSAATGDFEDAERIQRVASELPLRFEEYGAAYNGKRINESRLRLEAYIRKSPWRMIPPKKREDAK